MDQIHLMAGAKPRICGYQTAKPMQVRRSNVRRTVVPEPPLMSMLIPLRMRRLFIYTFRSFLPHPEAEEICQIGNFDHEQKTCL